MSKEIGVKIYLRKKFYIISQRKIKTNSDRLFYETEKILGKF